MNKEIKTAAKINKVDPYEEKKQIIYDMEHPTETPTEKPTEKPTESYETYHQRIWKICIRGGGSQSDQQYCAGGHGADWNGEP